MLADKGGVGRPLYVLLTCLTAWSAGVGGDDDPSQPYQELFLAESVYPQQATELEFTVSALRRAFDSSPRTLVPAGVEYGITGRLQVSVDWHDLRYGRSSLRPEGVSVGLKRSFLNIAGMSLHASAGTEVRERRNRAVRLRRKRLEERSRSGVRSTSRGVGATGRRGSHRQELLGYFSRFHGSLGPLPIPVRVFVERGGSKGRVAEVCPGFVVQIPGRYEFGFAVPVGLTPSRLEPDQGVPGRLARAGFIVYLVHEVQLWQTR
jgi:hypothetical protein